MQKKEEKKYENYIYIYRRKKLMNAKLAYVYMPLSIHPFMDYYYYYFFVTIFVFSSTISYIKSLFLIFIFHPSNNRFIFIYFICKATIYNMYEFASPQHKITI